MLSKWDTEIINREKEKTIKIKIIIDYAKEYVNSYKKKIFLVEINHVRM